MDKHTDWKKYVREETGKEREDRRLREEVKPRRQVPEIDHERYRIHRSAPMPDGNEKQARKDPAVDGEVKNPGPEVGQQETTGRDVPGKSNPLASPFVSVQQVWEAAERGSKSRKANGVETTGIETEQVPLPGIEPAPDPAKGQAGNSGKKKKRRRAAQEQSREEILERLVNPTITLEEAAKIMGVCKATVRRYTAKGILPHYRTPGNQRRFKLNDIIHFLEEQRR